jgi:hypothetical protein
VFIALALVVAVDVARNVASGDFRFPVGIAIGAAVAGIIVGIAIPLLAGELKRPKVFPDGSSLTWVDRETLRYSDSEYEVLAWVDYASGFFSRGRELRRSSIERWLKYPENAAPEIPPEKRTEIEEKIAAYFGKQRLRIV